MVVDAPLQLGDERIRVRGRLAPAAFQRVDELLHARVLAHGLVDEALKLGVARPSERGVENLLLDARMDVQLAADALDCRLLLARGHVARHAPHEPGEPAPAVVAGEELLHGVVVLLQQRDGVHVR